MANIPIRDIPGAVVASPDPSNLIPMDNGSIMQKTTIANAVNTAMPMASQSEAEAGADNVKRMSSLRTKQAIDAQTPTIVNTAITALNLGTMSQEDASDYTPTSGLAAVALSNDYTDLISRPTLGTAAATDASDYATAAQGTLADTAVQPSSNKLVPAGGTTGQVLAKASAADNDTAWVNAGAGGGAAPSFSEVSELLADDNDRIGYESSGAGFIVHDGDTIMAGGLLYLVAAEDAASYHVETEGGVKLLILAEGGVADARAAGAVPDVIADQGAKIQIVLDACKHVRFGPGTWYVDATRASTPESGGCALFLNDYQKLELGEGCVIQALPTSAGGYSVVYARGKKRPRIIGGGAIYGDLLSHTGSTGEWGFVVDFRGCDKPEVNGVELAYGWGDGVYLGRSADVSGQQPNVAPRVLNCFIHHNRRNNVSVVHARRAVIAQNNIESASGTSPEQGIDIEPNSDCTVYDVIVANNTFTGNVNAAVRVEGTHSRVQMVAIIGNTSRGDCTGGLSTEAPIIAKDCDFVTINGNTINTSGAIGILCEDTNGCIVTDNIINVCAYDGIKMLRCDAYQVRGNRIASASNGNSGVYSSIVISGSGASALGGIIDGNIGTGTSNAYGVLIGSDATNNETIINNRMTATSAKYNVNGKTGRVANNDNHVLALSSGAAGTQNVTGVDYIDGSQATTTAITALNNGYQGQKITVRGGSGFTLVHDGSRLRLSGNATWAPSNANQSIELVCLVGGAAAAYLQVQ